MKEKVSQYLKEAGLEEEIINLLEEPKTNEHGDYSLPCFSLAKKFRKDPNKIAQEIANQLKDIKNFEKVEVVGAYVNIFLSKESGKQIIDEVIKKSDRYGSSSKLKQKIMIEFSQPNTHKAFHVGHIRGTSIGESIARILDFSGSKVVRANYSGDTGKHIAKWIWCYKKYHSKDKLVDDENWIAGIYVDAVKRLDQNPDFNEEVEEINRKLDERKDKELIKLWKDTRKLSIKSWDKIYKELDTKFDIHIFESDEEEEGKKISKDLANKNIAKISDGAIIMDLKEYGLSVWVLLRKDGTVLYSGKDLSLALKKFRDFKLDKSVIITDSAQDLHFRQLKKTLELMNFEHEKDYLHISYGAVRFPWGKMSSRSGDNVLYSGFKQELVDLASKEIENRFKISAKELSKRANAIAIASMKYAMLKQSMNKNIIFDKKEAVRFEGDTGPYLLYSYARAKSILNKAKYKREDKYKIAKLEDKENALINEIGKFSEIVEHAANSLSPHSIANYAYTLSQTFNEFYHEAQVIGSEKEDLRLKIVDAFSQTLRNALFLLGIPVIEEM